MSPMIAPLTIIMSAILTTGVTQSRPQPSPQMISLLSQPVTMKDVEVLKEGRSVSVHAQFIKIGIHRPPNYQDEMAYILMLRESLTGLYWWKFQYAAPGEATAGLTDPVLDTVISFTDERAVGFTFWGQMLYIRDIQGHMPDFLAVQQTALAGVEQYFRANDSPLMPGSQELDLRTAIGQDFYSIPGHAYSAPIVISAVTHANGQWTVTLKGPNRNFAQLTLDEKYALQGVRRLPAAP